MEIGRILLALGAREVATGTGIFQAVTQVKTRVQQNPLKNVSLEEAQI